MTDLFERVLHHIEGRETEIQHWQTLDGIKTVEFQSFGPDRWIENVHERGLMTGMECLAIILYVLDKSLFDPEPARRIVESWAAELRKAVSTGEIQARDRVTLLALTTLPDGWEWVLSTADADRFITARGMSWRFDEIARQLFCMFEQAIQKRRFPLEFRSVEKAQAPALEAAQAAPVTPSASDAPAWTVSKPQRGGAYRTPLYRLLAAAHREGGPRPTARDVVEAWRINKPAEVAQVLPDGFDYYDAQGNTEHADLEAIRKVIERMTSAR